jgi:hypothetical protein
VGWLLFEVFVALAIIVVIVGWTIPKRPRGERPPKDDGPEEGPR